jgi:hypothetical protein
MPTASSVSASIAQISASAATEADAHRIGIALIELPEPARPRLLVAPDGAHRVAAVGRGQVVAELRRDAGERRGHVIAQRQPRAVVFEGEDPVVGAVHIGQELAQRLDGFHRARLQRIEAVAVIDLGDLREHPVALGHFGAEVVAEAFRRLRLGARLFLLLGHGCPEPYVECIEFRCAARLSEGGHMGKEAVT